MPIVFACQVPGAVAQTRAAKSKVTKKKDEEEACEMGKMWRRWRVSKRIAIRKGSRKKRRQVAAKRRRRRRQHRLRGTTALKSGPCGGSGDEGSNKLPQERSYGAALKSVISDGGGRDKLAVDFGKHTEVSWRDCPPKNFLSIKSWFRGKAAMLGNLSTTSILAQSIQFNSCTKSLVMKGVSRDNKN